ncbi:MAG TPA: response regulator transcription factor [Methylibium sp.]|uniref:response regulator transcription factor n=1 Tax=Methylibium sp. TaxID=2067992 RepID=UPI002DBEE325|nr:response regulator transcription factor [Methylibium sp.]HEU4458565.1 response regulator transcription factor [Methylibium sp.]
MRLLVVEDEPQLGRQLHAALQAAGYAVDLADNGIDGEHLGCVEAYDAVVLDIGLPGRDGLSVLAAWRRARVDRPVLLLTARASWQEKVQGIDAGADDYLAKPFQMEELLSRLRALIRRSAGLASPVLQQGDVALDTRACTLDVGGQAVALTAHEYRVLAYLMHQRGRSVDRGELAEHVYGQDADRDSNTLDVFVARLRRKLPEGFITTVRGIGWRVDGAGP